MKTIEIHDVTYSYAPPELPHTCVTLLDHMTLEIDSGEFVVLTGGDATGTSTFTRLLNGLLLPTSGVILIDGLDTRDQASCWEIRRRVGVIFRETENQIVGTTVAEDVAFGPENLCLDPEIIRERVHDALQAVGMSDCADVSPYQLNGVELLKASLAAVLAMHPSCIIVDQATAGLEPDGASEIPLLLQRLNRETGLTVLMIRHSTEERISADRTYLLQDGRLVECAEAPGVEPPC